MRALQNNMIDSATQEGQGGEDLTREMLNSEQLEENIADLVGFNKIWEGCSGVVGKQLSQPFFH